MKALTRIANIICRLLDQQQGLTSLGAIEYFRGIKKDKNV